MSTDSGDLSLVMLMAYLECVQSKREHENERCPQGVTKGMRDKQAVGCEDICNMAMKLMLLISALMTSSFRTTL